MLFKTLSAAVFGIDAYPVEVEVDISAGKPTVVKLGMPAEISTSTSTG